MAGSGAPVGFSAATFREAITFAMNMGQPETVSKRVTFRWTVRGTYPIPDRAARPYNWTATPTPAIQAIADLQVLCATQFQPNGSTGSTNDTTLGSFNETTIVLTLLDTQYDAILAHGGGVFPDLVKADDDIYEVRYIPPPNGLFDVTVWQVHCVARSETA